MTYASDMETVVRSSRETWGRDELVVEGGSAGGVHEIDPLQDTRWNSFVAKHPDSSVFHTAGWLKALQRTYSYRPVAYATTRGTQLDQAVVFCRVESRFTGRRLVSLPFSDHCQPLARGGTVQAIFADVARRQREERLRYVELRPRTREMSAEGEDDLFGIAERVSFQTIDLRPDLPVLYQRLHDSCIRRKIKRADREGLTYERGRSGHLLEKFRKLLFLTRRRHKLPPQPASWFTNLGDCLEDNFQVHMLSKGGVPAASIITLHYRDEVTYKYGCSDAKLNNLGGMPWLFWEVIQQAKASNAQLFDLGRSHYSDPGLIAFKEHLGAESTQLCYYRSPVRPADASGEKRIHRWAGDLFARMPDSLLGAAGELLYRHTG
jgi:hypothetical protein